MIGKSMLAEWRTTIVSLCIKDIGSSATCHRRRAWQELARLYRKTTNQRNACHWQLAKELCEKYSIICLEDLSMKFMQTGHGEKVIFPIIIQEV